jgi:hypothetical protein
MNHFDGRFTHPSGAHGGNALAAAVSYCFVIIAEKRFANF